MKHILATIFFSCLATSAQANYQANHNSKNIQMKGEAFIQMKGEALRSVFSDTIMVGEYRKYRDVTRTYNYTEHHYKNGTTSYVEGRKKEDGDWKIIGGEKICYKYPSSRYYSQTYCFYVFNVNNCYYKFTPRNMTLNRGPKNWNRWSSRAVRKGAGGICDEPAS